MNLISGKTVISNNGEILTIITATSTVITLCDKQGRKQSIVVRKVKSGLFTWKHENATKYDLQLHPTRFRSLYHGFYTVLELDYVNKEAIIKFDDTYNKKSVSIFTALNGLVEDKNILPEHAEGYYVYMAVYNDVVYYIGQGKEDRYKHVNSGISHNYDLNWYHFNNYDFEIKILKDCLSKEDSIIMEEELIRRHQPRCNKRSK